MRTRVRREVEKLLASIRGRHGPGHPTDRELVRTFVEADGGNPGTADAHVAGCARCAARARALQEGLDRMAATARTAFDDAVPPWRLARQRRRIMRRIMRSAGQPGTARILRFPISGAPAAACARPLRRRLSLAAVAGLLVVAGIGQIIDDRRRTTAGQPQTVADAPSQSRVERPAGQPQTVADEQFMRELEEALTSSRVTPLVALDEMTPRVRDAAIDIR